MANTVDQNDSGFGSNDDLTPKRTKSHVDNISNNDFPLEDTEPLQSSKRVITVTFKESIKQSCETSGSESVESMLKRHCKKHFSLKFCTKNMVFKRASDGCAINLGLPTDVLNGSDEYQCTSHNQEGREADYSKIRSYNTGNYKPTWNMGHFYIKIERGRRSQPAIGGLKEVAEKIRIDFFPTETLFESMIRDKRLKVENENKVVVAKRWYLKSSDKEIFLDTAAHCYNGQYFTLYQRKNENPNLPDKVLQLPEPERGEAAVKSSQNIKLTKPSNSYQDDGYKEIRSPQKAKSPSKTSITCDEDLKDFLKEHLEIDVQREADPKLEKKRISSINKLFKSEYNHFASTRGNVRLASKVKDLTKIFDSVGAVVVEVNSGEEVFMGTCFVIGSQYVITNRHVFDKTMNQTGFKDFYVAFEYKNNPIGYKFRFSHDPVASSPYESPVGSALDYAILENREPEISLPPSLTKCGYVIPRIDHYINAGDWLTLVGFPQQVDGKALEDACPLKPPQSLDENIVLTLSRQNPNDYKDLIDTRRQTYDTFAFFHGSSGSPGVLMNEKLLVVLHCRGFPLQDGKGSLIEQGVRMSAIRDDVHNKIKDGILPKYLLNELFDIPLEPKEEPMEIE